MIVTVLDAEGTRRNDEISSDPPYPDTDGDAESPDLAYAPETASEPGEVRDDALTACPNGGSNAERCTAPDRTRIPNNDSTRGGDVSRVRSVVAADPGCRRFAGIVPPLGGAAPFDMRLSSAASGLTFRFLYGQVIDSDDVHDDVEAA